MEAAGPSGTQKQYWKLYLVKGSDRVHPLANQPVVMKGLNNSTQPKYLKVMTTWYDDPSAWNVYLAASGPSSWARVPYGDTNVPVKAEPTTQVSDVVEHNASISFNVSRPGVPVVVTVSYFPNWHVSGAEGVYRISPNLMVVVPTSHHVSLSYGYTPVDYEGWALTLLALLGLVLLIRHPLAPVIAVRRPGLGRRAAPGPVEAAVAGRVRNLWGHGEEQDQPRPPWPNGADGPTNGAEAAAAGPGAAGAGVVSGAAGAAGTGVAHAHERAPGPYDGGPYDDGELQERYEGATSGPTVANPGSESHGSGRDAALEGQSGPLPPGAPISGQHVVADPTSGDDQRGETAAPEPG